MTRPHTVRMYEVILAFAVNSTHNRKSTKAELFARRKARPPARHHTNLSADTHRVESNRLYHDITPQHHPSPSLPSQPLTPLHRRLERSLEQPPPPLRLQILLQLAPPHMKPLIPQINRNLILPHPRIQLRQRNPQSPRLDRHRPSQRRRQPQLNLARLVKLPPRRRTEGIERVGIKRLAALARQEIRHLVPEHLVLSAEPVRAGPARVAPLLFDPHVVEQVRDAVQLVGAGRVAALEEGCAWAVLRLLWLFLLLLLLLAFLDGFGGSESGRGRWGR